jgi:hypothetical protein
MPERRDPSVMQGKKRVAPRSRIVSQGFGQQAGKDMRQNPRNSPTGADAIGRLPLL